MICCMLALQFFPTIDEDGWLEGEGPWLRPFLPVDAEGHADTRHVEDYVAMAQEIQAREQQRYAAWQQQLAAAGGEAARPCHDKTSRDQLYDAHRRAINIVANQQHQLTHSSCNQGTVAAQVGFWRQRIGGIGADPEGFTRPGRGRRLKNCLSGHKDMIRWQADVDAYLLRRREGGEGSTAKGRDLVAQTHQPCNPVETRKRKNELRTQGLCNGVQLNPNDQRHLLQCERDRYHCQCPPCLVRL